MSRTIGIGVIGAGTIAQISHIPYILDDEQRFKLLAISDINESLLSEVADHYHIDSRYPDYQALLDREDIDAVLICHSGSHHDSVLAALDKGKDILVEKPLAWPASEAQIHELLAAFEKRGLLLQMVAQWPGTLPAFQQLHGGLPARIDRFAMRLSPISIGPEMITDSAPHFISLLQALLGAGDFSSVGLLREGERSLQLESQYRHSTGTAGATLHLVARRRGDARAGCRRVDTDRSAAGAGL